MDNRTAVLANYTGVAWSKEEGPAPSSPQIVIVTRQRRGEAFGESSTFCHRTKEYRANATSIFWDVQDHVTSKYLLVDKHIYW